MVVAATMGYGMPASAHEDYTGDRYSLDPDIATAIAPQQTSVTLSTSVQTTYSTYRVTVTHYTVRDEVLKPVIVRLATAVVTADGNTVFSPSQTAPIATPSVSGGTCESVSETIAECTITDGLTTKGQNVAFNVSVQAPTAGGQIKLTADTRWREPNEYDRTEYEPQRAALTSLEAPQANKAKSFVPVAGSLFTVNADCARVPGVVGCAATPSDPWTTTITVQNGANLAEITEDVNAPGCARAGNMLDCRNSTISVPGYSNGLVIFLRRDGSTISGGNIKNAVVYYTGTTLPSGVSSWPLRVPACTDTTYGPLPQQGIPCINYAATANRPYVTTSYPKKTVPPKPPVPAGFEDDWEFVIYALDNGRYEQ